MIEEKTLLDLCRFAVDTGKNNGADDIEVQATAQSEVESDIRMGQVSQVNKNDLTEIAIRLYIGKRMGSAFTNMPTKEAVAEAINLAISEAKATTPDDDWSGLPSPSDDYPAIEGVWQDSVLKSESGEIVEIAGKALAMASEAEPGMMLVFGGSGAIAFTSAYSNSNDINHSERGTAAYVALAGVAQSESGMTPTVSSVDIRRSMDIDIDSPINDVASFIRLCKNLAEGKSGKHIVIFHPSAYAQVMQYTLIQSVRGDNVARGKSKIGNKIGEKIASEKLTIIDDGIHPRGLASSSADDEGVPRQKTKIIENGVLRSFLWDTYWANKMGVKSTGNARRNMRRGLVDISPSNLVVEPGTRNIEDIIKEIDYGYYIRGVQGAHSSNPESGDFSIVGNPAILIEKGELIGAVNGLMVSGNIFDMLNQVAEIARTPHFLQSVIGPEIAFKDVSIITKE